MGCRVCHAGRLPCRAGIRVVSQESGSAAAAGGHRAPLACALLAGCSSVSHVIADNWPRALGGLPEGVPPRDQEPPAFMPVHDMPPPRDNKAITPDGAQAVSRKICGNHAHPGHDPGEADAQRRAGTMTLFAPSPRHKLSSLNQRTDESGRGGKQRRSVWQVHVESRRISLVRRRIRICQKKLLFLLRPLGRSAT